MFKKYLFVSNLPDDKIFSDKILDAFRKKSFLTNSVLFFVTKRHEYTLDYFGWSAAGFLMGGSCKVTPIIDEKNAVENLMSQVDYYIVGNCAEENRYIDLALQNGTEIIGEMEDVEEIFSDIPIAAEVEQAKNNLAATTKKIFSQYPFDEYEYFLFHNGLGEALGFFFWLKEYRRTHHKKILLFCLKKSHVDLMKLCPYVDQIIQVSPPIFDYIAVYFSSEYAVKNFWTLHVSPNVLKVAKNRPGYAKHSGVLLNPRDFLEINPKTKFPRYSISLPKESLDNARKIFHELGLREGRTVFLVTEGISSDMSHHKNFWEKLAARLHEKNFDVATNSAEEIISGCKNIFLPLADTSAFIGLCGNVASVTTGFNEAICTLNSADKINLTVFLPGKNDLHWKKISTNFWYVFKKIRYWGRNIARQQLEELEVTFGLCMGKNIDWKIFQWEDGVDDDSLIEKTVDRIISASQNFCEELDNGQKRSLSGGDETD